MWCLWSIFKSRANGGFNPCFFQICSSDRIVSPRISGLGTWKKQHRSPVIWLDSCLHIFSLHRTIFQILCHLHKKPRKGERFSGWGDAISLLLPARECNKKTLPQHVTLSSIGQESWCCKWCGNGMIVNPWLYLWTWCFCWKLIIRQLAFFLLNLFHLPWEAPWANWQRCRWMAATELSSLVWRARSCHFAIAGSL